MKDSTLEDMPTPQNIKESKKLDTFMQDLPVETNKKLL